MNEMVERSACVEDIYRVDAGRTRVDARSNMRERAAIQRPGKGGVYIRRLVVMFLDEIAPELGARDLSRTNPTKVKVRQMRDGSGTNVGATRRIGRG